MKKSDIITLIRCFAENDDVGFKSKAFDIADDFYQQGDKALAQYIHTLFSNANVFTPQQELSVSTFFTECAPSSRSLYLPPSIQEDVLGVTNAISKKMGVNKFLFYGAPGTGKTESAYQVARLLQKRLFKVNFNSIIDSRLGQTAKNIDLVFEEINGFPLREKSVFLFDEIDALALDRINSNDLREMGRATSEFLKGLDGLKEDAVLIATTNLFKDLDPALIRRFDFSVSFDRYSKDDLISVALSLYDEIASNVSGISKNNRLFKKIVQLSNPVPLPGTMRNLLTSSIAFSSPNDKFDYLRRFFRSLIKDTSTWTSARLLKEGFSYRDVEILTQMPRSTINRKEKQNGNL
jgi:hypothetical protein